MEKSAADGNAVIVTEYTCGQESSYSLSLSMFSTLSI